MPKEKYKVELSAEEIKTLREITHNGKNHSAKTIMHANVLLRRSLKKCQCQNWGALLPIMLVEQGIKSKTCHILR